MDKERVALALILSLSLSACNEQANSSGGGSGEAPRRSFSVIGSIRPKADPQVLAQIQREEAEAERLRQLEYERQMRAEEGYVDPSQRNLPDTNMGSLAPSGDYSSSPSYQAQPESWAASAPPPPPMTATYGSPYNTGMPQAGFIPPPPAISLNTQAVPYVHPQGDYGGYPPSGAFSPPSAGRPAFFGSGERNSGGDAEAEERRHKAKNVAVITPTGMELRSAYKQRDDLRLLWKGTLTNSLGNIIKEEKFAQALNKVEIALPTEASKGSLNISVRQAENLFKNGSLDKKIISSVKRVESELVQSYYRFLYSYNKYSLAQQNVAARKQEIELAETAAEKQRAAADSSQAQNEAESSKEDMRSAQSDLASIAGAAAARSVIGKVTGSTPSMDSLAAGSSHEGDGGDAGIGGFFGSVGQAFGIGKSKGKGSEGDGEGEDLASAKAEPARKIEAESKKKPKDKGKEKGKKASKTAVAEAAQEDWAAGKAPDQPLPSLAVHAPAPSAGGPVSFELKDVQTTPRKSILHVAVRNSGEKSFSFDTDSVSVLEGNSKLADASVRADFDSTMVQPNSEISGTIIIFGRPWNDKLMVTLSEGGKTIHLHR